MASAAGAGVYLVFTALAYGRRDLWTRSQLPPRRRRRSVEEWLVQAGLQGVPRSELAGAVAGLGLAGAVTGAVLFGGVLPAVVLAVFAATAPVAYYRRRRADRQARAQEAWPRLIEEMRILTTAAGRSIPQALFEIGRSAPPSMRPAFEAAEREWLLTTDFARTVAVLKAGLADPCADITCETLLVAHEVGGADLDARLEALADDRRLDTQGRKDARAGQAGARFARRFVIIVPLGMALAGMSVGNGRQAYATPLGQLLVAVGLGVIVACWVWAGHIMRLPAEDRVFR
ncbi:MAG: hypothetical protein MUF83_04605 [Acidimicrobiales bacterium]|nr:hypothetical protein [Acidimicrobiales bacterium]